MADHALAEKGTNPALVRPRFFYLRTISPLGVVSPNPIFCDELSDTSLQGGVPLLRQGVSGQAKSKNIATALRMFLRFLIARGRCVLGIVDLGAQLPELKSEVLSTSELGTEEIIERAAGLAKEYKIVNVLEGPGVAEPVLYSPLIWGDKISKAGKALSHLGTDRREALLGLVEMIRK